MTLHSIALDAIHAKDKAFRLADGGGLFLQVQPNGSKLWRFRYLFVGTEKMLALGSYPATSLAEARRKRDVARQLLEAGTDPSVQSKIDRLAAETAARNTFKDVAEEHIGNLNANGAAASTSEKHRWLLLDVAAPLAHRPLPTSRRSNCCICSSVWRRADAGKRPSDCARPSAPYLGWRS